jgi:formylglycine-generating enzyme required for sulfatase activity
MNKFFLKKTAVFVIFMFCSFLLSDIFPKSMAFQESGKELLEQGEQFYKNGQYEKALETFEAAEPLIKNNNDLMKLYLNISLTHYALDNKNQTEEFLRKVFQLNPNFSIPEASCPRRFLSIFEKIKADEQTKKKKQEKVIEKPIDKKKKKKFPVILVVAGVALVGVLAALMMKGKKKDNSTPVQPEPQEPTTGTIRVESNPEGASIRLDGTDTGQTTPATLESINPGSHTIKLEKQGYWPYETTVQVAAGQQAQVSAALEQGVVIDWIDIPAGEFLMGDNFREGWPEERPVHKVYLDAYKVSKYEVTFEQYDIFCDNTGRSKPNDEGWGRGNRPVIHVSWHDGNDFCTWLSQKTGENIHLPTEAQWEKAARGTGQRMYPWGNNRPSCSIVNFNNCQGRTMPVGSYPQGVCPYGAYDMGGNVWEWCQDWYDEDYYSYSPYSNPQGPTTGSLRIARGGDWPNDAFWCRTTYRKPHHPPGIKLNSLGFRLARD